MQSVGKCTVLCSILFLGSYIAFNSVLHQKFQRFYEERGKAVTKYDVRKVSLDSSNELYGKLENLTIIVGMVVCPKNGSTEIKEEAAVTIKSILISALLNDVQKLELFVFLEHREDSDFFVQKIQEYGHPFSGLEVVLHVHAAIRIVPKEFRPNMIYDKEFRCGFVRIFFPSALKDVDAMIYVDTDTIVTGSILDLWNEFSKMSGEQLVAVARNNEPENPNWPDVYEQWFADIPHPPPKGLNSGVLLMNLSRMREYHWEEKITRLYFDYSKIHKINDQRLLNILLRLDEGLLHTLPCQYNFRFTHCVYGLYCNGAIQDPKGVQIIHGAADQLNRRQTFRQIYVRYQKFNMVTSFDRIQESLMAPLRSIYEASSPFKTKVGPQGNQTYAMCYGILNKLLYKNYFY